MAVHRFRPNRFFNVLGGNNPVLHLRPGDTLVTSTLDAHGINRYHEQESASPNPVTGPFYVEGVEPGDALIVRIVRIALTRDTGWSSTVLAGNVLEPSYLSVLPKKEYAQWRIDTSNGTATVVEPGEYRGRITLPLSPLIGCLGVSPADGQVFSTRTSAEHGGNMDYRGACQGATLYFPVFEKGALFSVGDVHAAQGDGEAAGTGIETAAEVELELSVRKKYCIHWPRGENETHIFTIGNARPLDQALQHATTEMHRWLCAEYNLDAVSASLLTGQGAQYDIANVFNPSYTVSCKIRKTYLSGRVTGQP